MDEVGEAKSLWHAVKAAWGFAASSKDFGRSFIVGEVIFSLAAVGYSLIPRVAEVPPYLVALSGVYFAFVALGELQFELWIKQSSVSNRDVILIGYKTISRLSLGIVFSTSIIALSVGSK